MNIRTFLGFLVVSLAATTHCQDPVPLFTYELDLTHIPDMKTAAQALGIGAAVFYAPVITKAAFTGLANVTQATSTCLMSACKATGMCDMNDFIKDYQQSLNSFLHNDKNAHICAILIPVIIGFKLYHGKQNN